MEKSVLLEKIEALNVKESWKEKFRLYAEAGLTSGGFFPKFENKNVLKGKFGATFNIFSVLFGPFYYISLGLYKKAGMIFIFFGIARFLTNIIGDNLGMMSPSIVLLAFVIFYIYFIFFYFPTMVNYDYYRKQVLGENFWW